MTDFTANFTLSEIETIDATFVISPAPSKLSELENDANYVQDADYVHTDNNFTDADVSKLAGIEDGAEVNVVNSVNGQIGDVVIDMPTATSDLTNDSGFITSADVPTALSELTDDATHRLVTDTEKSTWNGKQDALGFIPENVANKNANNGYCPLDSGGKVPVGNLPTTLLQYAGVWNASTNTPTLISPDLTKKGIVYNVSVAGTQFGINFSLGDWAIYNQSGVIEKSDNSDDVTSVNGQTGAVTITKTDVGLSNVDNTSDANKPVSTAQQTALDLKANLAGGNTFTGVQNQKSTAALDSAPLGSELLTNSNWTSTGWTGDFTNGFTHTVGNTTALSNTLAAVVGNLYQITYTVMERTAGSFTLAFGGFSEGGLLSTSSRGPKASTTGNLVITPTSDFNGTIVISIKQITGTYSALYAIQDSTGNNTIEIRSSLASLNNSFIGKNAGRYNTTGSNNAAIGASSLQANTTGGSNSAMGYGSLASNTTGGNNSAIGMYSLQNNTTGSNNSAQGVGALQNNTTGGGNSAQGAYALQNNTTGFSNSAQGVNALRNNITGSYNLAQGSNAGRYLLDESTGRTTGDNGIYIGCNSKASANGTNNEIVIGYNAIGNGSNTVTLGSSAVTATYINGQTQSKSFATNLQTLTDATNITWDMASGGIGTVTLAGNRAIANPSNIVAGGKYTLIITQDATGTRTLTYGSYFKFPGAIAPTLTSTANAVDLIEFTALSRTVLYCTNFVPDLR